MQYCTLAIQFLLIRSNMFVAGHQNWNWCFYRDGTMEFEVRVTGIVQVYIVKDNELTAYGTPVVKNVNVYYHQRLFFLRFDPMVDDFYNPVLETGVLATPSPLGSTEIINRCSHAQPMCGIMDKGDCSTFLAWQVGLASCWAHLEAILGDYG